MTNFLFFAAVIALGIFGADILNLGLRTLLMKLAVRRLKKQLLAQLPTYNPLPMLPMRFPDEPFGSGGSGSGGSGMTH